MDAALKAIKDAWESRGAAGEASSSADADLTDDGKVYKLADKYVAHNAADYAGFDNLSMDLLVGQLEKCRENGDEDGAWKIQAWLFHRYEPQEIGGTYKATVRTPNGS